MSSIVLKGNYGHLPQPPEHVAAQLDFDPVRVGHVALEHVLWVNCGELRALTHSLLTVEEQHVNDVLGAITTNWDDDIKKPRIAHLKPIFEQSAQTGLIAFDTENRTVRLRKGSEHVVAFANNILGVGIVSGVAIKSMLGSNKGENSWENLMELRHLRRLLTCMRIGKSNGLGVPMKKLHDVGNGAVSPIKHSNLHRLVTRLEDEGLVSVQRGTRGRGNGSRVVPTHQLREMQKGFMDLFGIYDIDFPKFVAKASEVQSQALQVAPHLYRRELQRSNYDEDSKLQPLCAQIQVLLADHHEGVTFGHLFATVGIPNNYSREIFSAILSFAANNLPGAGFQFLADTPGSSHGRWALKPTPNTSI